MKNEGLSDIEMAFVIYTSRLLKLLIYQVLSKTGISINKVETQVNVWHSPWQKLRTISIIFFLAPFTPYWVTTMFDRYTSSIYNGTLIWCELAGV